MKPIWKFKDYQTSIETSREMAEHLDHWKSMHIFLRLLVIQKIEQEKADSLENLWR